MSGEVLLSYMEPVPDHLGCGVGEGAACCAYLTMTPGVGFTCEQNSPLAQIIRMKVDLGHMTARRLPVSGYPACQGKSR